MKHLVRIGASILIGVMVFILVLTTKEEPAEAAFSGCDSTTGSAESSGDTSAPATPVARTTPGPAGWASWMPAKVGPYGKTAVANAAQVIKAGQDLRLDPRSVTIGVMTAMGESGLQVLDRGDAVGPDSRGLFQQRDNGAWGTYNDRMNPYVSATNFFKKLMKVPGYRTMTPTLAAHAVQANQDENHYTRHWPDAVNMVAQLTNDPTLISTLAASAGVPEHCDFGIGGGGGNGTPATCGNPKHSGATPDGTIVYSGRCWLAGSGLDIRANGGSISGTKWQCTELVRRFWWSRGWAPRTWHGGTGRTIWNYKTPAGAESLPQGQITRLGAGDIISIAIRGHDLGHTGVVNAITKKGNGYQVEMMSQNTSQPLWYFTWDGKSLHTPWSGYTVTGVMHRKA